MYLGPEMKFLVVNAMKNCTDMYIVLALNAMEGQLTENGTSTLGRNVSVGSHQFC